MLLRFSIYGRFEVEVESTSTGWNGYRCGSGIRRAAPELIFPQGIQEHELATFLDDIYHEYGLPGRSITRIN